MKPDKSRVLFVCAHNSARSQMAEAILRHLFGEKYESYSAGTEPNMVHPFAIKVMEEIGIDISRQRSKGIDEFTEMRFDVIATVCDQAKENCPYIPGAKSYLHMGFPDPSSAPGNYEQRLDEFRKIRDAIRDWIAKTFSSDTLISISV